MVSAVVCMAPETMPSASPSVHHHGAEVVDVADHVVRQLDRDALVRAQPAYSAAKRSRSSGSAGSTSWARRRGRGRARGRGAADRRPSPSRVRSATPRRSSDLGGAQDALLGALGQHDVAPVGAGPLDQLVLEHQRRDRVRRASTASRSSSAVAVDVLLEQRERRLDLARVATLIRPSSRARGRRRSRTCRARQRRPPAARAPRRLAAARPAAAAPPVRTTPATAAAARRVGEQRSQETSARSPGVISTTRRRSRRSSRFGTVMRRHERRAASRPSASGSPPTSSPSQAASTSATVGAMSRTSSGTT